MALRKSAILSVLYQREKKRADIPKKLQSFYHIETHILTHLTSIS